MLAFIIIIYVIEDYFCHNIDTSLPSISDTIKTDYKNKKWRYIIIHHTASLEDSLENILELHVKMNNWDDVGYHFLINNGRILPDGFIEVSRRWRQQNEGAHTKNRGINKEAIGIALVGNFEIHDPTTAQLNSLVNLIRALIEEYKIPVENIFMHKMLSPTKCPGSKFPFEKIIIIIVNGGNL
ncbi:MAG: peptidoglycan recognition family protein [Pseudomonadota bacterium]